MNGCCRQGPPLQCDRAVPRLRRGEDHQAGEARRPGDPGRGGAVGRAQQAPARPGQPGGDHRTDQGAGGPCRGCGGGQAGGLRPRAGQADGPVPQGGGPQAGAPRPALAALALPGGRRAAELRERSGGDQRERAAHRGRDRGGRRRAARGSREDAPGRADEPRPGPARDGARRPRLLPLYGRRAPRPERGLPAQGVRLRRDPPRHPGGADPPVADGGSWPAGPLLLRKCQCRPLACYAMRRERLTRGQARRIALAAQGFGRPQPAGPVTLRHLQAVGDRLARFQIDSINIGTRAQYMPLFSRLGPYDPGLLDRAGHRPPRRLFEYWGHAASLIDVSVQPLLRFRMQAGYRDVWSGGERVARENPALVDFVHAEVAARGPISARELEVEEVRDRSSWGWNWSSVKTVLEWLFYCGEVTSVRRNSQFERVYDLPERVLPPAVLAAPTPSPEESVVGLVRRAAQALGVASEFCLRDYFRTRPEMTRAAGAALGASGELLPVTIQGWEAKP